MTVDGESVSNGDEITLFEGKTANIAVFLDSVNVTGETDFAVADSSVLDISENGVIATEGLGSTTVILTFTDGNGYVYTRTYTIEVKEGALELMENGESTYSIVLPAENYEYWNTYKNKAKHLSYDAVATAAAELQYFFNEATGVSLNIVSDSGLSHQSGQTYISLGNTALYTSCGEMLTAEEKAQILSDGSKIFNVDKNVYLVGGTGKGTCFAVYEWMSDLFNYDYFARDCWYIDDTLKQSAATERNLSIENVNKLVIPSVAVRGETIGGPRTAPNYSNGAAFSKNGITVDEYAYAGDYAHFTYQYRARISEQAFFDIHTEIGNPDSTKTTVHNTYEFLSSSDADLKLLKAGTIPSSVDPNWIGDNANTYFDICYSAHGVAASYNAMVAQFANKILYSLQTYPADQYPTYANVNIAMEDGWGAQHCDCDACSEIEAQYGSTSYAGLKFTNDVANYLYDTLLVGDNAQYKRDDFRLLYFAYGSEMSKAPNPGAEVEAEFDNFAADLHECVGVHYAVQNFSYYNDIDSEVNAEVKANALAWSNLVKEKGGMALWSYSTNPWHYLYYFDSISFYETKTYDFFVNTCGIFRWRNENQGSQYGSASAFSYLQWYLDVKLMWDCTLDSEELIVKWFENKFGAASDEMFAVFNRMRADFREAVMPGATYDEAAGANGFRDYNIQGSPESITLGESVHPNNPFVLNDNNLPFSYGLNATYSIETTMDWLQMFDAAFAALDENDPNYAYQKKAIETEWLTAAYGVLNRANASLNTTVYSTDRQKSVVLSDLKAQFKETVFATRLHQAGGRNTLFTYNTFVENETFFEVLGYRGILTSLKELVGIAANVNSGAGQALSSATLKKGNTVKLFCSSSNTNCTFENVTFTFENNVGDNGNTIFKYTTSFLWGDGYYKLNDSGTVTVIMTYTLDGVEYSKSVTVTVSAS